MNTSEQQALDDIREALHSDDVRLNIVRTFTHGGAVQVESRPFGGRWKKAGPLLFPPEGGALKDTLAMLAEMRESVAS